MSGMSLYSLEKWWLPFVVLAFFWSIDDKLIEWNFEEKQFIQIYLTD